MNPIATVRRYLASMTASAQTLEGITDGIANLTDVMNRHLMTLAALVEASVEEGKRADTKQFASIDRSRQMLEEIREGIANLTEVTNRQQVLTEVRDGIANLTDVTNRSQVLKEVRDGIANLTNVTNRRLTVLTETMEAAGRLAGHAGGQRGPETGHPPARPEPAGTAANVSERFIKPVAPIADYKAKTDDLTYDALIAWHSSEEFRKTHSVFDGYPTNSLIGGIGREILYHIVRSTNAQTVIEVGTYFAGTSEVIARALWENGDGTLHTTDPFGAERCPDIIAAWPGELQRHVRFYPLNSMDFFLKLDADRVSVDVAFIDGNHDYEFAYFDLCSAAKLVRPGGVIVLDNIEQPGPFWAAVEFLRANRDWKEVGDSISGFDASNPFDGHRGFIGGTPFVVLVAPSTLDVGAAPRATGQQQYPSDSLTGVRLRMVPPVAKGVLHLQVFLRGFSDSRDPQQLVAVAQADIDGQTALELSLPSPLVIKSAEYHTFESVLFWQPDGHSEPLRLNGPPAPFAR